jgi:hypothetical protein
LEGKKMFPIGQSGTLWKRYSCSNSKKHLVFRRKISSFTRGFEKLRKYVFANHPVLY